MSQVDLNNLPIIRSISVTATRKPASASDRAAIVLSETNSLRARTSTRETYCPWVVVLLSGRYEPHRNLARLLVETTTKVIIGDEKMV